jgi:glycosyltransferase involved in cell wall biosynthesis
VISVVIPIYNKERFIYKTIESVLKQRFELFELLVINDGSTDNSLREAQKFQDERIRIISIDRSGVSKARNIGIENSKYNWIAFLDADDYWAETFLDRVVDCIERFPRHKLYATGRTHFFPDSSVRYENEFLPDEGDTSLLNFFQVISKYLPLINSSNAVIKKTHFEAAGYFRENQKMHEDHDLWMRLCINEDVVFINKNLSFYRNTEKETASKLYYEPEDFCIFLNTLIDTSERINSNETRYFKKYANKFVILTYIKNYANYTKKQDQEVRALSLKLVTGGFFLLLKLLGLMPFKQTYRVLKFIQNSY